MTRPMLGGYRLEGVIGSGTSGTVFLGIGPGGGRVAVKVLAPELAADDDFLAEFRAEAAVMQRVAHPNCVGVVELIDAPPVAAIVSELVNGASLRTVLDEHPYLRPERALAVLQGALRGLAHLHDLGLVHRDVKPANILVTTDGVSKLADFGLARPVAELARSAHEVLGTPAYMSPEQIRGEPVDHRSDIYACGTVLFEALTGRRFSGTDTAAKGARLHRGEAPPDLHALHPEFHPAVAALLTKALAPRPADRHQSALELLAELETAAAEAYGPDWATRATLAGLTTAAAAALAAALGASGSAGVVPHLAGLLPDMASLDVAGTFVAGPTPPPAPPPPASALAPPPAASPPASPVLPPPPTPPPAPGAPTPPIARGSRLLRRLVAGHSPVTVGAAVVGVLVVGLIGLVSVTRVEGGGGGPTTTLPAPAPAPEPETKIVFASYRNDPQTIGRPTADLYVLRTDGSVERITHDQFGGGGYTSPEWSPDGARIVATHHSGSTSEIVMMNADGSNERPLSGGTAANPVAGAELHAHHPTWSPDGRQIAFVAHDAGRGIYVVDVEGPSHRFIPVSTRANRDPYAVTWSPDGRRLAYSYVPPNASLDWWRIGVVNVDGSGFVELTKEGFGTAVDPAWSPDGAWLVVSAHAGPNFTGRNGTCTERIAIVAVDGTVPPRDLPKLGCAAHGPSWSTDGLHIVFSDYGGSNVSGALYIIRPDGSDLVRITDHGTDPSYFGNGVPSPEKAPTAAPPTTTSAPTTTLAATPARTPAAAATCVFDAYLAGDRQRATTCSTSAEASEKLFTQFQPNGVTREELRRWSLTGCSEQRTYWKCTFTAPADVTRDPSANRTYDFVWEIVPSAGAYYYDNFQFD